MLTFNSEGGIKREKGVKNNVDPSCSNSVAFLIFVVVEVVS
jgi:hypothetical protein